MLSTIKSVRFLNGALLSRLLDAVVRLLSNIISGWK